MAGSAFKRNPFAWKRNPPCIASRDCILGSKHAFGTTPARAPVTLDRNGAGIALSPAYRGGAAARLSDAVGRSKPPLIAVAAAAALLASGCSLSYNLASMTGKDDVPSSAGRISSGAAATDTANAGLPSDSDLAHARAAVAEAFSKGVSTKSASWENPSTGAHGTVTPINASYQESGGTCRDFLASYVLAGDETWLEGAACRRFGGRWTVERLRPWKRA